MTGNTAIEVSGLAKTFGPLTVLSDISFSLERGSTVALLGPSGCGKTTILRCLAGLERPDAGRITVGDRTVFDAATGQNLRPEQRQLGVVFQSYAVWPHMTVGENVGFPLKIRGMDRATIGRRVEEMLEIVGLGAMRGKMVPQLSGGQQQRVAIARALIGSPQLVLFDEALSNLDAQLRDQMRLELQVLQQKIGFTALYVTHDQTEAFALAQQVILMNRGRIETAGPPEAVFARPASPFVATFLGLNVFPAAFASDGPLAGDRGQVILDGGVPLRGIIGAAGDRHAGRAATVCIRREHLRLEPPGTVAGPDLNALPAEIVASAFLGLQREYLVRHGGLELKVLSSAMDLGSGGAVQIVFRPEDTLIFPT